jgi:hypothetical protein
MIHELRELTIKGPNQETNKKGITQDKHTYKKRERDSQVWRHSEIVVASLKSLLQRGQVMHAAILSF